MVKAGVYQFSFFHLDENTTLVTRKTQCFIVIFMVILLFSTPSISIVRKTLRIQLGKSALRLHPRGDCILTSSYFVSQDNKFQDDTTHD